MTTLAPAPARGRRTAGAVGAAVVSVGLTVAGCAVAADKLSTQRFDRSSMLVKITQFGYFDLHPWWLVVLTGPVLLSLWGLAGSLKPSRSDVVVALVALGAVMAVGWSVLLGRFLLPSVLALATCAMWTGRPDRVSRDTGPRCR
jgi:hypothetical protein